MKKILLVLIPASLLAGFLQSAIAATTLFDSTKFSAASSLSTKTPKSTRIPTTTGTETPPPPSPSPTFTLTPTFTPTPDCAAIHISREIAEYNRLIVNITNDSISDQQIAFLSISWQSAQDWAEALDYANLRVDWISWNDVRFYDGDDYATPTETPAWLLLPAGTTNRLEIDFDFEGEESSTFQEVFGLEPENFGLVIELAACAPIIYPEKISKPPEPNCKAYKIGDVYFGNYAHIFVDITNNDLLSTRITEIEVDWKFAEKYDYLVDPETELSIDFMYYGGRLTWGDGDGSERDFDSPTNTSLDFPETFPGSWISYELPPFASGATYTLDIDFDGEWATFPLSIEAQSQIHSSDFGVTFTFENGCILHKPASNRGLPQSPP